MCIRDSDNPYDFSFSGLKSAVLNYINHAKMVGEEINVPDLAASFQNAVVEVLVSRTIEAAKQHGYKRVAIAGGVASNSALRAGMEKACKEAGIQFFHPSPIFCTDNAAMIGAAAYYEYKLSLIHILMRIAVHGACRGRGYGRLLMERLLREAKEENVEDITLEVRASNAPAIALYEACLLYTSRCV